MGQDDLEPQNNVDMNTKSKKEVSPQKDTSGKCPLFCYVLILYLPIILLVVVTPFSIDVKICLAVFLCIRSIAFYFFAYDCSKKDKLPYKISWLVGLSLLFILIIVIGLFANTFSGFSVTVPRVGNFNGPTITLTSVLLFILSIFISILSGYIVYKKDEEKKQKQQSMVAKIKWQENCLDIVYNDLKKSE
ncbi:hypothetical protein [Streptococcus sinensis]|uniref:hypothetical protein n=1 Tax=Streptococcus sinensis TaxID=176090 RepID=UPI00272AE732|nr:hypothetical protein [Streptococcus sinensis]